MRPDPVDEHGNLGKVPSPPAPGPKAPESRFKALGRGTAFQSPTTFRRVCAAARGLRRFECLAGGPAERRRVRSVSQTDVNPRKDQQTACRWSARLICRKTGI